TPAAHPFAALQTTAPASRRPPCRTPRPRRAPPLQTALPRNPPPHPPLARAPALRCSLKPSRSHALRATAPSAPQTRPPRPPPPPHHAPESSAAAGSCPDSNTSHPKSVLPA